MQVSKEFLMEAVGLSLLVALIFIGMQMFQKTIKVTSLLEAEQEERIIMMEEYDIAKYDGLVVDGLTAVGYIKKMVDGYELPVVVAYNEKTFSVTERSELGLLRDIDSEKYISPYAKYRCSVVRDENAVIKEILLMREKEGER